MGEKDSVNFMDEYEYCPRCDANLMLQKGYRSDLPFWKCRGCGEMLINPNNETDSNIVWICDGCGAILNLQKGFREDCGEWICTECGTVNPISDSEIFRSEDEYEAFLRDPYQGLTDEDLMELLRYQELENVDGREDVILTRHCDTGKLCVKKLLTTYNKSVYEYLTRHPIEHMPRILGVYEGTNGLMVLEEYVAGHTLEKLLEGCMFTEKETIRVIKELCTILEELHSLPKAMIHRDVKPSNVMLDEAGAVWLLDVNVAKWHDPVQKDDTRYLGTQYYAAPEQVGYGFEASSPKSDVYAVGILMNVMLTGKFPKEEKAPGKLWPLIERCISLEAERRFSARELREALEKIEE